MLKISQAKHTEVIQLSYWVFAIWWLIILSVHTIAGVYAALYAYCCFKLQGTYLNLRFEQNQIGLPPPYHRTIAGVHVMVSILHAACIFLMLSGSLWQRSLAFTPWSSCNTEDKQEEVKNTSRTNSAVLRSITNAYTTVSDRHGICGVNSDHFHVVLIIREVVETTLQTVQAYRMSVLLPWKLLNRFYVFLLVVNCWSSVVVYSTFFKADEARRRFVCLVLDCMLDLMACVGVGLLVLLNYTKYYDGYVQGFDDSLWQNDEWTARATNEFRMVMVTSWTDLASRAIFSFGLILTASSIKTLLQHLPRKRKRVDPQITASNVQFIQEAFSSHLNAVVPEPALNPVVLGSKSSKRKSINKLQDIFRTTTNLSTRTGQALLITAHLLFGAWGLVLLGLHIHASIQPTLPQCLMQVRPWGASRPACYLVGLDCYTLGISGKMDEVEEKWSEFDGFTVVQLLIRHCPTLEMPDSISNFRRLHSIKVYNTTIVDWGESAALTNTNHPDFVTLYVIRATMTNDRLPLGFQSPDFPQFLTDIEFCGTNLRELPDDLDLKWHTGGAIRFEYSQLETFPFVLLRLEPMFFALTGNPFTSVPPEVFESPGLTTLGLGSTSIRELPRNVTNLSPTLRGLFLDGTEISFFWPWMDEFLLREQDWRILVVTNTPYCTDLVQIQSGSASVFQVPSLPENASILMDPAEANEFVILDFVHCVGFDGPYYLIQLDDDDMAISPPPALPTTPVSPPDH
ncbi:unnamed protein product [Phytophthora fragariaefolia]|uniref:Unnamed protein product n=1 Tax=Phytophthora fragariaefolia TaxID=1490495 RepID=A0A9W6XRC2_9STRA|nr:unnamed protein product [Phytophthora fragariaefolia]